jgi:type III secretion system FlhB-like substrate exporter
MTDKVVGVSFDAQGHSVPSVVVKGAGADSAELIRAAERAEIPVVHDPALVQALYRVPMDAPIGRELFPVMAALIAHILNVDSAHSGGERR